MPELTVLITNKPERRNGRTIITSRWDTARVDRIRRPRKSRSYEAHLTHPEEDDPHGPDWMEWRYFQKKLNPDLDLPVLDEGEEAVID